MDTTTDVLAKYSPDLSKTLPSTQETFRSEPTTQHLLPAVPPSRAVQGSEGASTGQNLREMLITNQLTSINASPGRRYSKESLLELKSYALYLEMLEPFKKHQQSVFAEVLKKQQAREAREAQAELERIAKQNKANKRSKISTTRPHDKKIPNIHISSNSGNHDMVVQTVDGLSNQRVAQKMKDARQPSNRFVKLESYNQQGQSSPDEQVLKELPNRQQNIQKEQGQPLAINRPDIKSQTNDPLTMLRRLVRDTPEADLTTETLENDPTRYSRKDLWEMDHGDRGTNFDNPRTLCSQSTSHEPSSHDAHKDLIDFVDYVKIEKSDREAASTNDLEQPPRSSSVEDRKTRYNILVTKIKELVWGTDYKTPDGTPLLTPTASNFHAIPSSDSGAPAESLLSPYANASEIGNPTSFGTLSSNDKTTPASTVSTLANHGPCKDVTHDGNEARNVSPMQSSRFTNEGPRTPLRKADLDEVDSDEEEFRTPPSHRSQSPTETDPGQVLSQVLSLDTKELADLLASLMASKENRHILAYLGSEDAPGASLPDTATNGSNGSKERYIGRAGSPVQPLANVQNQKTSIQNGVKPHEGERQQPKSSASESRPSPIRISMTTVKEGDADYEPKKAVFAQRAQKHGIRTAFATKTKPEVPRTNVAASARAPRSNAVSSSPTPPKEPQSAGHMQLGQGQQDRIQNGSQKAIKASNGITTSPHTIGEAHEFVNPTLEPRTRMPGSFFVTPPRQTHIGQTAPDTHPNQSIPAWRWKK